MNCRPGQPCPDGPKVPTSPAPAARALPDHVGFPPIAFVEIRRDRPSGPANPTRSSLAAPATADQPRHGGRRDGRDPGTLPNPTTWIPLVPNPAYSDYTTGRHGAATSPFAQVLRQTLGDDTPLTLRTPAGVTRHYDTLTALESDALNARIWGGLHFRDAMEDGYYLGHTTADRVIRAIR